MPSTQIYSTLWVHVYINHIYRSIWISLDWTSVLIEQLGDTNVFFFLMNEIPMFDYMLLCMKFQPAEEHYLNKKKTFLI